jgi:pyruvate/2-oxoglutarate dehydrogenase complex dihydrolipoamide acyltransferase (E2) component
MALINVPADLWTANLIPEGSLERWLVADGENVEMGSPLAIVRVEDALHEVLSPLAGRVTPAVAAKSAVEPGSLLADIECV